MSRTPTVGELVAKAGVTNIDRECDHEDFLYLASFCDPWQLVGAHLRLSSTQLSNIDADNKSTALKRLKVLHQWKSMYVFRATFRVLIEALIDCSKTQQALEVCKYLARREGRL